MGGKGGSDDGPENGQRPRPSRLFEAFVVSAAGPGVAPVMMYCYAPAGADLMQYKVVPEFSFPESELKLPPQADDLGGSKESRERETFAFVLTGGDGTRLHGYCRRYATAAGNEEVACILTQHSWYDVFSKILDAFQETACSEAGAPGVASFARNLQHAGLPAPGRAMRVPMEGQRELEFVRPWNTSECRYDARLCELFRCLPVSKTVMLFFLMLTERRVILLSSKPSRLSNCAHALSSLLYPFAWQHIYVPILVPKMLDYVCAPMPFLIGMHIAMLPSLKNMPMEEVVMVDLDRGRLRYNEKDVAHLPDEHFDAMCNALMTSLNAKTGDDRVDWAPLANVFLDFFLSVFSTWRRFVARRDGAALFDQHAFRAAQRKSIVKFLAEFERSQMYEEMFRARTREAPGGGAREDDPFDLALALLEEAGGGDAAGGAPVGRSGSAEEGACGEAGGGSGQGGAGERREAHAQRRQSRAGRLRDLTEGSVKHLWHSMEDLGAHAARGMKQLDMKLDLHLKSPRAYRPAYLRDEAAYVSGPPHLLSRIFRDLGLLAPHALPAADADAPPAAPPGSEAFQEHWFGPAAARWAMRGRGGGREPTADAITDMELEMQTRYFKELNDKLRLQAGRDTDDGGTPPAPDRPRAETGGAAPAAPGAEGGGGWITFADEDGAAAVVAGDWGTAEGALIDLGEEARGEGSSRGSQQAQQAEEAEGGPGRAHAAHGPASGAGAPAEAGDAGKGDSDSEQDELAALFGAGLPPAPASGGGAPLPGGSADGGAGVDLLS